MSRRRSPGEIVKRTPGSGFLGNAEPSLIQVPPEEAYTAEADPCLICDDPECREWANLKIVAGPLTGEFLYHISECEMKDASDGNP